MSSTNRIGYIDLFRGIGITLMVMGHIGFGAKFDFFIHAFHMPMFFFVSGYFFRQKDRKISEFFISKVKTLLIPYFFWGSVHFIIWILINRNNVSIMPILSLISVNTNDTLPIANALWFLTALFWTDIIYSIINKLFKNLTALTIVVIILATFGTIATRIFSFRLPWALDAALVGVGFYHIARLLKSSNRSIQNLILNMKLYQCFLLGVVTVGLTFTNGYINMRTGQYAILPLFWINSILAIIVGLNISRIITQNIVNNLKLLTMFVEWMMDIGENSITYLCLNQLLLLGVTQIAVI